jgi:hypothetical protein
LLEFRGNVPQLNGYFSVDSHEILEDVEILQLQPVTVAVSGISKTGEILVLQRKLTVE